MPRTVSKKVLLSFALVLAAAAAPRVAHAQGTWTQAPRNTAAGGGAFGLWLLTDGTVLSHGNGLNHWVILTPDKKGSYINGTWKSVAASVHARSGATQHMLRDGRFFQAGGEFIDGPACTAALCSTAEVYDPVANTWTDLASAPLDIGDTGSANLPDGRLIYSTRNGSGIQIYDPVTNTWTRNGNMPLGTGDENAWAALQNGAILAVGFNTAGAALYNPASNTWIRTGAVPSGFNTGDTGGITQMFDGRVYVYGLNFHSYIYTPGATATDPGTWAEGPKLLDTEAEDEYSDILPNGMVMGGLVHVMFGPGTILQIYDPTTNMNTAMAPANNNVANVPIDYVNLPNGQVMITGSGNDYILTLDTGPQDAWRPTVTSVVFNASANTYTLTGTQITGLVNGADEGDDMTMAENYPIVWMTDAAGNVYYARTFNISQMTPSKGSKPETCDFTLPAGIPQGSYNLFVSAVGVQSKNPFPFTVGQSSTGTGGTTGTGGATGAAGSGGTTGAGGTTGSGGATGAAGSGGGRGGAGGTTGAAGSTGGAGTTGAAGATGAAGSTGAGGTTGAAGATGGGGSTGIGGTTGTTGTAGTTGAGGTTGGGGSTGTAGGGGSTSAGGHGGGTTTGGGGTTGDSGSSGCACEIASPSGSQGAWLATALGIALAVARRRKRSGSNT